LVVSTPLKNMKVSWDYYSQHMEKCSKAPTSHNDYDNNGVINYDNNGYNHYVYIYICIYTP
jgi:hypothetical protein